MQKFESNPRQRALSPFSGKVASVVSKLLLVVYIHSMNSLISTPLTGCSVLISEKSRLLRCYSNLTIGEIYCRNSLPLFHHSIFSIWDMLLAPFAPCRQWKQRVVSSSEAKIGIVHAQYIFACRTRLLLCASIWMGSELSSSYCIYQYILLHYCLLQEKLVDKAVVQFYHRPSQLFLGVHRSEVTLIDDEEDNKSNRTEPFEDFYVSVANLNSKEKTFCGLLVPPAIQRSPLTNFNSGNLRRRPTNRKVFFNVFLYLVECFD